MAPLANKYFTPGWEAQQFGDLSLAQVQVPEVLFKELDPAVADAYLPWFQAQIPLFIVPYQGKEAILKRELEKRGIAFTQAAHALCLENGQDISEMVENGLCRVQDFASAKSVLNLPNKESVQTIWDACAGAGGKTLMLREEFPDASITASDKRASILENLKIRFQKAQLKPVHTFTYNLENDRENMTPKTSYDLVVADVPCSGSGTWRHNPEQAVFFDIASLSQITERQKKIVRNAIEHISPRGVFVYITCSVFKQENQDVVQWIVNNLQLTLLKSEYCHSKEFNSDYIFRAIFQKK